MALVGTADGAGREAATGRETALGSNPGRDADYAGPRRGRSPVRRASGAASALYTALIPVG